MDPVVILFIVLGVSLVSYVGLLTFKVVRAKKRKKAEAEVQEQKIKENLNVEGEVRYTMEENPVTENPETNEEQVNATFLQKDFVLQQNTPYEVSVNSELKPGKYIVLSTDENQSSFYLRVGIYVRQYNHNQEIILAEGDTVCAVSGSVILR